MSHSAAFRAALEALRPPGWAMDVAPDSDLGLFWSAVAEELARFEDWIELVAREMDPRTTSALLARWEAIAGLPEPCADPLAIPTDVAGRRAALVAKLTAKGNLTLAYIQAQCEAFGYTVSLDDSDFPYLDVTTDGLTEEPFILDSTPLDSSLDGIGGVERLECLLERIIPAHLNYRLLTPP